MNKSRRTAVSLGAQNKVDNKLTVTLEGQNLNDSICEPYAKQGIGLMA